MLYSQKWLSKELDFNGMVLEFEFLLQFVYERVNYDDEEDDDNYYFYNYIQYNQLNYF